jgi:hypothetical protein
MASSLSQQIEPYILALATIHTYNVLIACTIVINHQTALLQHVTSSCKDEQAYHNAIHDYLCDALLNSGGQYATNTIFIYLKGKNT